MMTRSACMLRALLVGITFIAASLAPVRGQTPSVPPAQPAATDPAPASVTAVIHPGDMLAITLVDEPGGPSTVLVQADGTIQYGLVGRVFVAGMTAAEARDVLARAFRKYYRHPNVLVSVIQQGQINVGVYGNVKASGRYTLRTGAHFSDAFLAAGGLGMMNGDYPPARVTDSDGTMRIVNVDKLIRESDMTQNVPLEDGSIVYVTGGETFRVVVLGAVSRPGNVEVTVGDRLSIALARAGAEVAARSDLSHVYLTRVDPATGKTQSYVFDVNLALEKSDVRYDPILLKGDKIKVNEARSISPGAAGILNVLGRLLRI